MSFFKRFIDSRLLEIIFYLIILIVVDNLLLQGLASPRAVMEWFGKVFHDPQAFAVGANVSSINPALPPWLDSFIWVLFAVLLWVFNKKRLIYWPLILYNAWLTFWIIIAVMFLSVNLWNPQSGGAEVLLSDAFFVWISNLVVFAVWYWILDHKNQNQDSIAKTKKKAHFLFAQTLEALPGWEQWKPGFVDYLFFSFNTSTAFGASDTLILTKRAKILIIMQSLISLILFVVIAARAINIIK